MILGRQKVGHGQRGTAQCVLISCLSNFTCLWLSLSLSLSLYIYIYIYIQKNIKIYIYIMFHVFLRKSDQGCWNHSLRSNEEGWPRSHFKARNPKWYSSEWLHVSYGDLNTISPNIMSTHNLEFQEQPLNFTPLTRAVLKNQGFVWNHRWWNHGQIPA